MFAVTKNEGGGRTIIVSDRNIWGEMKWPFLTYEDASLDVLASCDTIVLSPRRSGDLPHCERVLDWKRNGYLDGVKIVFGAFYGRHICSPENDVLVHRWVVHSRSEREALNSDKLVFLPLCIPSPRPYMPDSDDGTLFAGGRTWREFGAATTAMARTGLPGRLISDLAPPGEFPGVEITRTQVPGDAYIAAMERAKVILIPLKRMPISHGHRDVVTAIMLGKPVVVTAGASCDDYVQHGVNGLRVPENTVEAWEEAIRIAYDRADEFAAASRAIAAQYHLSRYPEYLEDILANPDRNLVLPDLERAAAQAPRSEWEHLRQESFITKMKLQQRTIMNRARDLIRQKKNAEALVEMEPCLEGPFRTTILQMKKSALMRMNLADSESFIRSLIDEEGETAELRTDLAASLVAQKRLPEALAQAKRAVELDPGREISRSQCDTIQRQVDAAASKSAR